ncbi:MAG: PAS domain S-box protein [Candidatus Hodarchaeota archaeon]
MISNEKNFDIEKEYKNIVYNLDVGFFRVGLDGIISRHNPKFNEIFGINPNENLVGTKSFDFWYNSEDRERFIEVLKKNGYVKNYVVPAIKVTGEKIIIQGNSHLIKNENGNPIATEGTIIDISDKYFLEQKLKKSEEQYRDLVELLPDIIYEANLDLNLTYVNSVAFKKFGYTQKDLNCGINIVELIDPEYKEKAFSKIKKIFEGKSTDPDEYLLYKKDGSNFYARIHSRPVYNNGNIVGIRGTINDINEMILKEQELKESEEIFRTIAEQSFMGIIIIQDGLFKYFNEQARKLNEYSFEEIQNWEPYEFAKLIHPDDKEFVMEQVRKKQIGEKDVVQHHKYRIITKTGEVRWIENFSKTIKYKGRPADLVMSVDITDKINAEQRLKESEEKYRSLFENMNAGFAYHEVIVNENNQPIDYVYHEVNPAFENLTGLKKEDLIGKRVTEAIPGIENDPADWIGKFGNVGLTGVPLTVEDYSEAIDRWYKVSGYSPKKGFFAVTFKDITDRKKAEEALKASEEKYRKLFENSPIALMDQDYSEMKTYVDHLKASGITGFEKYFDDNPEEILNFITKVKVIDVNRKILEVYKAHNKEDFILRMNQLCESQENKMTEEIFLDNKMEILSLINGEEIYESEIATKTLTGEDIYLYAKTSIVPGFEDTWSKVIVSIIDITERKFTEQKLKESEEKFRHLYENSPYAILLFNTKGDILDCNFRSKELSGFEKSELIGKNFQEISFIPKEYLPLVLEDFKVLLKEKNITPKEIQLYRKDKSKAWISYQASIFHIENEMIFQVIIQDITERKEADQKVIESEEKYHNLFETSPNGVILSDLNGTILECNSSIESMSGYPIKEFIGKNFLNLNFYKDNALEILQDGFKDLFGDNRLEYIEFPIKHKDNHTIWVRVTSSLVPMKTETFILSVIYDITTQKKAEEALKRSEEKYRDLLETSSVGVIELDVINHKMTFINPKLSDIIGYNREELNEEIFLNKLMYPKDLSKLLRSNEESELEFRIFDKQGRLKWLAGKRIPNFDENGEIISIRVWLDDITEKKMYEELIYELNTNFLNFTADIRNNIELLLNTGLKLLNGDLIIYAHKIESAGQERYQIITSDNETFFYNSKEFYENLFISELFKEGHDFPQQFSNINNQRYTESDPFIKNGNFNGCFGKIIKSQDGLDNMVCVFYSNNPFISGQDKLVLFLICDAIEIEQRRWQVQRDLEKQNITLNEINKLKTELFSRTSHELKTPLISIKGFTELLLTLHKAKLDSETISILKEIKDGSKRLEKIINMLLESTKLEEGQLKLNLMNEDLTFLINFCVKELKGLATLRNQSILFNPNNKIEAKFDKERIYEVISNLLLNAVKYTPPRGTISIETKVNDDSYIISVKDNGIGFTEEEKNQVFKQFGKIERYGQGWDVAIEGTGLGLYITKKLVELHGGKIWLESEGRNKGSTFSFTIPKL